MGITTSSHNGQYMNNIETLLQFPFRDKGAWTQFLIACAVMLAAFIIPVVPTVLLMGYTVKIMRQIILEKKSPSMPAWQSGDWSEMLIDGLRLYGAQLVLMSPLLLLMGCGAIFILGGSFGFSALNDERLRSFLPAAGILFFIGIFCILIFSLLSLPFSIFIAAATGHVAAKRSFSAAFEFREWWLIFRAAIGQFLISYVVVLAASFIFALVIQIAMITILLICIVPFLMIPYTVYLMLVSNALYAQAYAKGQESLHIG
jgi:hypothetical protein